MKSIVEVNKIIFRLVKVEIEKTQITRTRHTDKISIQPYCC